MIILSVDSYRDGGTLDFKTTDFDVHVDRRGGTTTPGALWKGYPEKLGSSILNMEEIDKFWRALQSYEMWTNHIFDTCEKLFEERGYEKPIPRVDRFDTFCECGTGCWSMSSEMPKDTIQCSNCKKLYSRYIYLKK